MQKIGYWRLILAGGYSIEQLDDQLHETESGAIVMEVWSKRKKCSVAAIFVRKTEAE